MRELTIVEIFEVSGGGIVDCPGGDICPGPNWPWWPCGENHPF